MPGVGLINAVVDRKSVRLGALADGCGDVSVRILVEKIYIIVELFAVKNFT